MKDSGDTIHGHGFIRQSRLQGFRHNDLFCATWNILLQTANVYLLMNLIDVAPGPVGVLPQECILCSGLLKSNWELGSPSPLSLLST